MFKTSISRGTVMDREKLIGILELVKSRMKDHYGKDLFMMILYGSQARRDSGPDSDIDIAIVLNKDFNKYEEVEDIVEIVYDISLEYDQLISVLPITMEEFQKGTFSIYENIRREGVVV